MNRGNKFFFGTCLAAVVTASPSAIAVIGAFSRERLYELKIVRVTRLRAPERVIRFFKRHLDVIDVVVMMVL